jgi:hypothetical protein
MGSILVDKPEEELNLHLSDTENGEDLTAMLKSFTRSEKNGCD